MTMVVELNGRTRTFLGADPGSGLKKKFKILSKNLKCYTKGKIFDIRCVYKLFVEGGVGVYSGG